ncbi:HMG (high mobility group) box domain containing protein [Acanthamoeba castellanii str. Neff]|uniref:HMG (High mobility group) box domain containing protein n=1 Tax=Acanthamoeba castellanii (strain ATCC 30010 / Neff) TaxID=1257118 RepID=L8HAW4_ACACF|nr:HMG (high mobility group) box domain containing protein [Acanthamoeba castellanii str. Neff]ELR22345.1 HMG (high mobility group) box domain containing protein [Acanthamoeba castellanii str. Neff]
MSAEKVKKPLSSYLCFCQEERETFKAQNPDAGMTDILKLMGEAWKDMPQAQRARYEAMAAADKARYTAELASSGANTQLNEWME